MAISASHRDRNIHIEREEDMTLLQVSLFRRGNHCGEALEVNGLNVTKESAPQTQDWERGQVKFLSVRTSLTKRSGDMVTSPCWTGEFLLENKRYCYPLTVSDYGSRYLLLCEAMESFKEQGAFTAFERLFKERGLPQAIRSDNGVPFASPNGLFNLSRLAVWWLRLGITIERIQPGHPQQNGRHERMHRTLKIEATRPAGSNFL
jgi:transposase InsO family protein